MKTLKFLSLLISYIFILSCSTETYDFKNQTNNISSSNIQVSLLGKINTRVTNNQWDNNDEIGIFMYKHGETLSEHSIINNTYNRKYRYSESNGFTANSTYDIMYYPALINVDFVAYYPFSTIDDYGIKLNTNNQRNQSDLDLLFSGNLTNIAATEEAQKLIFEHQLSKIIFTINTGSGITLNDLAGLSLSINGLITSATFSLSEGELVFDDVNTPQNIEAMVATSSPSIQAEAIIIPQSCNDKQIVIMLLSGKKYTFNFLTGHQWLPGNRYRYEITLTDDTQEATIEAEITDWKDNESSSELEPGNNSFEITPWNGEANTDWYSTTDATMEIFSAKDLAGLAKLVNNGISFEGKVINLNNDLDMNNLDWIPIGSTEENSFKGTFNGGHHLIKNLSPIFAATSEKFAGLFGINSGSVENIIVDGKYTLTSLNENIIYIGGIAGINNGIINNARSYSTITGYIKLKTELQSNPYIGGITGLNNHILLNCQNYGNIIGKNINTEEAAYIHIGGISGANIHTIKNCENIQNITAENGNIRAGGITGLSNTQKENYPKPIISNCTNIGSITLITAHTEASAGGIVGQSKGGSSISNSVNKGAIYSVLTTGSRALGGGIVAYNEESTISNCSNKGEINTTGSNSPNCITSSGGIVGYNTKGAAIHTSNNNGIISASASEMNYIGGITGYNNIEANAIAYTFSCCKNEGYPTRWIGNSILSTSDLITTSEHSDNE